MQRLSWKYIAGFVDGEGCIDTQIMKGVYIRPRLRITQTATHRYVLDCLHTNFGGYLHYRESNDSYTWALVGYRQTCWFLRNIVKHLYGKKEQARFVLWMEQALKGKQVPIEVLKTIKAELRAMKRDPHRLSADAVASIEPLLKR